MDCSTPNCRDGLKDMINEKVSKKGIWTTVTLLVALICAFGVYSLGSIKEDRKAVTNNTTKIMIIEQNIADISTMVEKNQEGINDIKEDIQDKLIDPKDLEILITRAVKKGNK